MSDTAELYLCLNCQKSISRAARCGQCEYILPYCKTCKAESDMCTEMMQHIISDHGLTLKSTGEKLIPAKVRK